MVVIDDWLDSLKFCHPLPTQVELFWLAFCHSVVWLPSLGLCVIQQVINWSGRPVGNGVDYPVREGSSKYDFTMEQIEQKKKRTRMHMVSVSLCVCACVCEWGEVCVCV